MSTLAQELKSRGIRLVDPLEAAAAKAKQAGLAFNELVEEFDYEEAEVEAFETPPKKSNTIRTSLVAFCNKNTKKESSHQKPTTQNPSFQPSNTKDDFEKGVQC
jgi:hypothetical protein